MFRDNLVKNCFQRKSDRNFFSDDLVANFFRRQFGWNFFHGLKSLFGPFLRPENIFLPYFSHFLTNLAKKKSGPKTTIWTLFRPRNQLFTIFWPFFDQFGQKKIWGRKPLFGPFLGLENNFSPYFGHFLTNLDEKKFWAKNHYLDPF